MIKHKNILTAVTAVFLASSAFAQQTTDPINGTIAIGDSNTVATTKTVATAIGGTSSAIAIGMDPKGNFVTKAQNGGVAMGVGAQATGMQSSIAVGPYANASGNYAACVGSNCQAGGYLGSAFGPGAQANYSESAAFGGNSVAGRDREVSFGAPGFTRYLSNVTAGTQATDATNLQQVQNIASSTLDEANGYTDQSFVNYDKSNKAYINSAVAGGIQQANNYTDSKFEQSKTLAYSGAAMSMASSALVFDPNKDRQVAVGAATVHGKSSIAAGVAWKAGRSLVNIRAATGSNGMSGVAGGASWSW